MIKSWYAVYTKPQQEQKVTAALSRKGIDTYCPLTRVSVYRGFGKKINLQPLFPSFVFVHIIESQLTTVRQAGDVINFMFWLGKPAIIPAAEIQRIQQFATIHPKLTVEKTAIVRNAAADSSTETLFNHTTAVKTQTSTLSLPTLGYKLIAETGTTFSIMNYTYENN